MTTNEQRTAKQKIEILTKGLPSSVECQVVGSAQENAVSTLGHDAIGSEEFAACMISSMFDGSPVQSGIGGYLNDGVDLTGDEVEEMIKALIGNFY
jgi:hypothetical protein